MQSEHVLPKSITASLVTLHVQIVVQKILVVLALCSVPVLLLGKPMYEYITFKRRRRHIVSVCLTEL